MYRKERTARGTQIAIVGPDCKVLATFDPDEESEADALLLKMNQEKGNNNGNGTEGG